MANLGTAKALNRYFSSLQVSSGTTEINKLHTMCLMPLFEDLFNGKMKRFTDKDKTFWQKLLDKCFSWLETEDTSISMNTILYVGTGSNLPDGDQIAAESMSYDISKNIRLVTPRVLGSHFWIAVPTGHSLDRVNNLDFAGDYIKASGFKMESKVIKNGHYNFYWLKSMVPFRSTYQIILK